jgi:hypothetical protein
MTMYSYPNESAMRQAHPYLANHLATIAIISDGIATAQTNSTIYQWRVS